MLTSFFIRETRCLIPKLSRIDNFSANIRKSSIEFAPTQAQIAYATIRQERVVLLWGG
jgi:hypothetical protein